MTGSASRVPSDHDLWLIVRPILTKLAYPQPGPAATTTAEGRSTWTGSAYLGEPTRGVDERFEIVVVTASPTVSRTLAAAHATYAGLPSLPPATRVLDTVAVTRDAC